MPIYTCITTTKTLSDGPKADLAAEIRAAGASALLPARH